jgi:hypothetical protein
MHDFNAGKFGRMPLLASAEGALDTVV